jgi:hypothetical protein
VAAEGASVKLGVEVVMVSAMVVFAVVLPEVPVMVTVDEPAAAVLLAVNVSTLVPVVGLVAKAAVTPVGNPDAARVTEPVNPPASVTVMVSAPVLPCATDREAAEGVSVKPGAVAGGPTESAMVTLDGTSAPELPVMVTEVVP